MTHTSSCLTFNQRANSWRQPCSAPSPAHSHCPSELRYCCHAHTMTAALIGFSLLRRRRWRWRNKNNNNNKNKNTKSDNENENENCNFRQAAVARFHFTLLWPVFAGFSLTFFHRLPGFSFFSLAFFAIGAHCSPSLTLALSLDCYFSVTKFTFHTFITFGSCN